MDQPVDPAGACAVCGSPEPFALAICPACAAMAPGADTLVFLTRARDRPARRHTVTVVADLLGPGVRADVVAAGATGTVPLVRAPVLLAERVAAQLTDRGLPAALVPLQRAFERVPATLTLLVLAACAVGFAAGATGTPLLAWLSPVMAVGLLAIAWRLARRPVWRARPSGTRLGAATAAIAAGTLAELPEGEARHLFAVVVRHGRRAVWVEGVESVVVAAAAAARTLARLEEDLVALDAVSGVLGESRQSTRVRVRAEGVRATLSARLREVGAALTRLRVESGASAAAADIRALESLARDLATEAARHQEALTEVAALLHAAPAAA